MKNFIYLFFFFLLFTACNKEKTIDTNLPRCLMAMVESENLPTPIAAVRVQEINKELHYLLVVNQFNTDFDIVDRWCNELCYIGYTYHPSGCSENYNYNNWETIWER